MGIKTVLFVPLILLKTTDEAVEQLRAGVLVIYPTETAYALGADATNERAVRRVFSAKRRTKNKTLPLIVGSWAMASRYGKFSASLKRLAKRYWPGPLTIVVPARGKIARGVLGQARTAALRVSSHHLARTLSQRLHRPIVSTSANLNGQKNIYSVQSLKKSFAKTPHKIYFLSGDTLPRRPPSTIVALKNGMLKVLRQGSIKVKGIRN